MCYWKPFSDETLQALCMFEQWVLNPAFEDGLLATLIPPTSLSPVGTIPHRRDKCQKAFNILRMQMTAKTSSSEWNVSIWKLMCCLISCDVYLFERLINPDIKYVISDFRYCDTGKDLLFPGFYYCNIVKYFVKYILKNSQYTEAQVIFICFAWPRAQSLKISGLPAHRKVPHSSVAEVFAVFFFFFFFLHQSTICGRTLWQTRF